MICREFIAALSELCSEVPLVSSSLDMTSVILLLWVAYIFPSRSSRYLLFVWGNSNYKFGIIMLEKGACDAAITHAGAYIAINQIRAPIDFMSLSNVEMTTFSLQGTP